MIIKILCLVNILLIVKIITLINKIDFLKAQIKQYKLVLVQEGLIPKKFLEEEKVNK